MPSFDRDVAGIGVLADPVRRQLYRFVCAQPEPVSRDQAAEALEIPRHQAKFHLDRLEAEGLLQTDYVRLTGRSGPGAGRPAKRYRRGDAEFLVALPDRDYELAGQLMAQAIEEATRSGTSVEVAVDQAATREGAAIAARASEEPSSADDAVDLVGRLLAERGYEPRRTDSTLTLVNCPFHALAQRHTDLVCGMNHALVTALVDTVAADVLEARLDPGENRCCVTLTRRR